MVLANEADIPSTEAKVRELNKLLEALNPSLVEVGDLRILDDLITVLHNTGNLLPETRVVLIDRQEKIRSRLSSL
ncbi:MAG: hypothetical protein Q7U50_09195 [Candidatus Nitrotoga sp.]|nr:hypothetical protein [Candidatus Nitrotoga sp.]